MGDPTKTTLFAKLLREQGLSDDQVFSVMLVMSLVCNHCWDAYAGCNCCNDE